MLAVAGWLRTQLMPTYKHFEELPVWQLAAELYARVDDLIDRLPPILRHSYREQLERATLSISNNIAEGYERGSPADLVRFLNVARGAAGEVRSLLILGSRRPYLANFRVEMAELIKGAESCSRQLRGWIKSLQESEDRRQPTTTAPNGVTKRPSPEARPGSTAGPRAVV